MGRKRKAARDENLVTKKSHKHHEVLGKEMAQ